jgi:hypothetical protein
MCANLSATVRSSRRDEMIVARRFIAGKACHSCLLVQRPNLEPALGLLSTFRARQMRFPRETRSHRILRDGIAKGLMRNSSM